MAATQRIRRLTGLAGLALALSANAALANSSQLAKDKDWLLTEHTTTNGSVCVAATSKSLQKATYRLEIQRAKSRSGATEVLVREMKHAYGMTGFHSNKDVNGVQLAFPKMEETADSRFFWLIPNDTRAILTGLAANKELRLYAVNPTREIKFSFSNRGFAKILQVMQEKCSASGDLLNADFEIEFLSGLIADRDPSRYDVTKTRLLRDIFFRAASVFDQKRVNNDAIRRLVNEYSALINEGGALESRVHQLANVEIPYIERAQVINQNEKVKLDSDLKKVRDSIPGLDAAVKVSEKKYDDAYKIIEPHLAEHAQLSDDVSDAERSLIEWENYLANLRTSIASKEREAGRLEQELTEIGRRIYESEHELIRINRLVAEERRNLRDFNRDEEVRRRLRNNSEMPGLRNQLQTARGHLPTVRQEAQNKKQIAEAAQMALRECQRTPEADCSSQQATATNAINDKNQANRAVSAVENDIERLQNRIRTIEDNIEREVESEYRVIERRLDRAIERQNSIIAEISRDESRAKQIRDFDLPAVDRDIAALEAKIPEATQGIDDAEDDVADAEKALTSFETRVGWKAKKLALDNATADRNQKRHALAQAQQSEANLVRALASNALEKDRLATLLSQAKLNLSSAQARLAQVNAELVPYRSERANLDNIAAGIQSVLDQEKSNFSNNL